jgi:hypothetical protein
MVFELRLSCMKCFAQIGAGPLRPATVVFLNTLAAEHICSTDELPPAGGMSPEEIQTLIDADKAPT